MPDALRYSDAQIRSILDRVKTVAMVGASTNVMRPSHFVMLYLQKKGYRVIPVNPGAAGQTLLGETVVANLQELPVAVDMVDVFRRAQDVPPIADDAIRIGASVLWMQQGVRNDDAAQTAEAAGLEVIMDRCPKIEYGRLYGEIGWLGVNRRIVSAKRGKARQLTKRSGD